METHRTDPGAWRSDPSHLKTLKEMMSQLWFVCTFQFAPSIVSVCGHQLQTWVAPRRLLGCGVHVGSVCKSGAGRWLLWPASLWAGRGERGWPWSCSESLALSCTLVSWRSSTGCCRTQAPRQAGPEGQAGQAAGWGFAPLPVSWAKPPMGKDPVQEQDAEAHPRPSIMFLCTGLPVGLGAGGRACSSAVSRIPVPCR